MSTPLQLALLASASAWRPPLRSQPRFAARPAQSQQPPTAARPAQPQQPPTAARPTQPQQPPTGGDAAGYDLWWRSDATEVVTPMRLKVDGSLPKWLRGSLVRVGPGSFEVGRQQLQHQIDGLAKLTKYRVDADGVHFQTRMLQSYLYNRTQLAAPPSSPWALWTEPALVTMLPVEPTYTPCQRVRALLEEPVTDNTNIFIGSTGDAVHASSDTSVASNTFDLETLASTGHLKVEMEAPRRTADTVTGAHKQRVVNGSATVGWVGRVEVRQDKLSLSSTVVSVYRDDPLPEAAPAAGGGAAARRRFIGQLRIRLSEHGLPMIHSFQVTERYVILVVCSLRVEPHLVLEAEDVFLSPN